MPKRTSTYVRVKVPVHASARFGRATGTGKGAKVSAVVFSIVLACFPDQPCLQYSLLPVPHLGAPCSACTVEDTGGRTADRFPANTF